MPSQNLGSNTSFNFEYALTIIIVLVVCNTLMKKSPQMSSAIVVITGLLVGYISLLLINKLLPNINAFALSVKQYYSHAIMSNFNQLGYLNIWPPILAVLIIFIILLYNKNLG
jgi:hypothetical protein